ncbi:unnamed protein product [Meloidogyne enterolobii]|uniref:Uncharacterized protein n=1 Tax=Meloidogyne enterolobii TaxID=390850 RepID=A0ACB0ZFR4_MELEN
MNSTQNSDTPDNNHAENKHLIFNSIKKKMTGFVFKEDKANNITHCTFCQREFVEDEAIVKNTCGHYYHYECFEGKKNCPSCHSPLKLITNKDASALNEKLKLFDLGLEDKLCF